MTLKKISFFVVISFVIISCGFSHTLVKQEVGELIRSHLKENLSINNQVDGIFVFTVEIKINKHSSEVTKLLNPNVKNTIYKDLEDCLKTIRSNRCKGFYNVRINLNLISNEYSVLILDKGVPPQKPVD